MSNAKIYLKNSTLSGDVNLEKLQVEISNSSISKTVMNKVDIGNEFAIIFNESLNQSEETELNNLISSHSHLTIQEQATIAVKNAVIFGQNLIVEFAGENVALGITQAGKTKAVADYLVDVTRYVQTGSLYEVVTEIDRLINAGLPVELEPFITQTRLEHFKAKILTYLAG